MDNNFLNGFEDNGAPDYADSQTTTICITDPSSVVVLFGPAFSGKTMTLIRLSRYLHKLGCSVVPDRSFRPPYDKHYADICDSFVRMVYSGYAAPQTTANDMLLVEVYDRQRRKICQLLDAPGDFYFDKNNPQVDFPVCIRQVLGSPNKKVVIFFVEPGWENYEIRRLYVQSIGFISCMMSRKDDAIFLFNKIDRHPLFSMRDDMPKLTPIISRIRYEYTEIFTPFENKKPFTRWFRKYNCRFVPFVTGFFNWHMDEEGGRTALYIPSNDIYPQSLWKAICCSI